MTHDAEQRIRDRAYHLWEGAGRPHGRDHEFWEQACEAEHLAAVATPKHVAPEAAKPAHHEAKPSRKGAEPRAAVPAPTHTPRPNGAQSATAKAKSASTQPVPAKGKTKRGSEGKPAR